MLNRRQFLVSGGASLGAWALGARLARLICRLAHENRRAYLVELDRPEHTLYATCLGERYIFTLDEPYIGMEDPDLTWRDWLTRNGVRSFSKKDICELLVHQGWLTAENSQHWVLPNLDDSLPRDLLQQYLDWDYAIYDSPTAQAFHYLDKLPLANRPETADTLGSLDFCAGTMPGNNDSLVFTRSLALVGGLQQRLLQLEKKVRIVVE